MDALIGYTGFVGGNLRRQHRFDRLFNSENISEVRDASFRRIVHAGTPGVKWRANQNPAEDWSAIETAVKALAGAKAEEFVLISTVDVLPSVVEVDESFDCTTVENHPYGSHRLRLEKVLCDYFEINVVRLPALFGEGLKKNVVFDLLNDNGLEKINPESRFQYYDLSDLWADIECICSAGLDLVHLVTEPIATSTILEKFFPDSEVGRGSMPAAAYDVRSLHAALFGGAGGYIRSADEVLSQMDRFISRVRSQPGRES